MDESDLPDEARAQIERVRKLEHRANEIVANAQARVQMLREDANAVRAALDQDQAAFEELTRSATAGSEVIAQAWADYEKARTETVTARLRGKSRPAPKAADAVREKGRELREVRREAKLYKWIVALYEAQFPWLKDLRDEDEGLSFLQQERTAPQDTDSDPARQWLTDDEWKKLSSAERSQRALDRYRASRKTPWQLGRDYERYVGYLRECDGWKVTYQGIIEGFDDLGRDLVCVRGNEIEIVQCKRWAQRKTIHEKHVFQLFGTVVAARIDEERDDIRGTFVTTTTLSDRAHLFAKTLGIEVTEKLPLADYPVIKCNVARDGERIYHLPFDQQYDPTIITPSRGDRWAATAAEAENAGFRRAMRWRGNATADRHGR